MAVSLPALPEGSTTTITFKSSAIDQAPYLGGAVQRVARMGDRWSYSVDLRPMGARQSRALIALLLQGATDKLLCPIIVPGISLAGQTDVTAQSGAGRSLTVTGNMAGKFVGQHFSLVKNGVRYLHIVTAMSGQTINFLPSLKVPISGGEVLEFAAPKIEGFPEGNETTWTTRLTSAVGYTLVINEAQ